MDSTGVTTGKIVASGVAHSPMTIKDAIVRFQTERDSCASPALREVINDMIDRNIKTEFSNDSYPDALTLTDVMFSRSTQNIRMLTGAQGDGFLKALKDSFVKALDKIKLNGGRVRVIVLGQTNRCLDELQRTYPETLEVIPAHANSLIKHFTVCDSRMARMEEVHEALTDETLASAIKARVCFNDPVQAKALEEFFDQIWNRLKQLLQKSAPTQPPAPAKPNEAVHTN